MSTARTVTIPQIEVTVDQLVTAIRQLEPSARKEIAKVLAEVELDMRFAELITSLANRPSAVEISDAEIAAEVNAVRQRRCS